MNSSSDATIQAEFNSLQRLYAANPDAVPRPHKWGRIQDENYMPKSQESREKERERKNQGRHVGILVGGGPQQTIATYFIVCDFVHCSPHLPSPSD
jgi:hypothetical protein